jgi:hypothetical protein
VKIKESIMAKLIKTPYEFVEGSKITLVCTKQEFDIVEDIFGFVAYESENADGTVNVSGLVFEERFERAFAGESKPTDPYRKLIEKLNLRHWNDMQVQGIEETIAEVEDSELQKPDLTEIKELVKSPTKGMHTRINAVYAKCVVYAKASGNLRILNDMKIHAGNISMVYLDCFGENSGFENYVYNHEAFDTLFAKIEQLLNEAEEKIAVQEAKDILFNNFIENHPDADWE